METVKEDVRSANKTEVAADRPTCNRHDMPSEETEAVKEGTSTPTRDRKTRGKKAERNPSEKFHCAVCSFLARETRATFTRGYAGI